MTAACHISVALSWGAGSLHGPKAQNAPSTRNVAGVRRTLSEPPSMIFGRTLVVGANRSCSRLTSFAVFVNLPDTWTAEEIAPRRTCTLIVSRTCSKTARLAHTPSGISASSPCRKTLAKRTIVAGLRNTASRRNYRLQTMIVNLTGPRLMNRGSVCTGVQN